LAFLFPLVSVTLSLLMSFGAWAQNTPLDAHLQAAGPLAPLKIESSYAPREGVGPGSRIPVSLKVSLARGYSAYGDKFRAIPLAPDGLQISDVDLQMPVEFTDFAKKKHQGLQNKGELKLFVELPKILDGPVKELLFDLEYIACNEKVCLPLTTVRVSVPIEVSMPQKSSSIETQLETDLVYAFLLVFFFGFLTSLTPCVYPLIPITLAVIGARSAKKSTAFIISFVYVFGIAITYAVLGVVAAQTGALFGQALSYPPVVIAFSVIFFVMALSLFGFFEIRAPHFLTDRLTKKQQSTEGLVGAFFSGMVAGVIASPCVGPVLVSVLAYIARSQNSVLGFFLLFTFAMGMGVLLIVIGTFSSLVKALPRSGTWMNRIKILLGIVMLGVSFYYIKPLLPEIHLVIGDGKTSKASDSKKFKNGWQPYSPELLAQAKKDGKPVIIDFFADWCAACVELDEKTFSTPEFIKASERFVLLKVDATESFPGLSELQREYQVYGLPTIVFITKDGTFLKENSLAGFEDIKAFRARMEKLQ
jgi:thioredoxin:protein disulfide reductase